MNKFFNFLVDSLRGINLRKNIYTALILRLLIILFLFSLCRIGFYLFNASYFPDMQFMKFMKMMGGGLKFDISAILYTNLLFILFHLIPFRFRYNKHYQTGLKYLFFILNGIILAANCADFIYYKFILKRTTAGVFEEFANETNIPGLLIRFIFDFWYIFLFWVVLITTMVFLYRLVRTEKPKIPGHILYYTSGLVLGVFFSLLTLAGLRGGVRHSTRPITLSNAGKYVEFPNEMAIVLNTPFSIYRTLGKETLHEVHFFDTDEELTEIYTPVHLPEPAADFREKNIIIFILESFATEYIGSFNTHIDHGNYKGFTPFMDSLISESKVFWYSFANGRKSIDALPSILSGIPSVVQPFVLSHYSGNKVNSLATCLKDKGYHTSFFHGAPNGSMGFQSFVNLIGFDHYYGKNEYGNNEDFDGIWGVWDEEFFQFFARSLNGFKEPFLSAIFSVSSHHPFDVPEKHQGKFRKGPLPIHQTVHYTDYSLQRFFERVSEMPWYNNTLFVFTADHASTPYYKEYKTNAGFFAVPVIFFEPGSELKGSEYTIAQQTDIFPTILSYLNYDKPYIAFGQDLLDETVEPIALNYLNDTYQLFMGDYLYQSDGEKGTGLFHFKEDKMLENNLLGQLPEIQEKMKIKLYAFIQQYHNRMIGDSLTIDNY